MPQRAGCVGRGHRGEARGMGTSRRMRGISNSQSDFVPGGRSFGLEKQPMVWREEPAAIQRPCLPRVASKAESRPDVNGANSASPPVAPTV
jgi:hypothetical protein